ncbi:unnamed protein product [Hermetia illucens]|uniref:Uncharacterized protein n=1 Tax=Hermetia illucens TaxID=343691 RepID=A0A7R8Z0N6_HERIL|nr:serine protease snake-like [Hermetia illucens]CAD7092799.1 unnamed protein product [Hermetia illucens]
MILRTTFVYIFVFCGTAFGQYSGEPCTVQRTSAPGTCKIIQDCPVAISQIRRRQRITRCGFEGRNEVVCCPNPTLPPPPEPEPMISDDSPISQRKCKEYTEAVFEYIESVSLAVDAKNDRIRVDKCGHKTVPLIVGGELAKPREFPHMALLGFDKGGLRWSCGGTLVSDQYVLSAGHCLRTKAGNPGYVRLGELVLLSDEDEAEPQTLKIIEIILHPDYKTNSKYNDIGLAKMEKKVKLTPFIRPACLPTEFGGPETLAIASGWGHTEFGANEGSNHLLKVVLTKFSHQECNMTYVSQHYLEKKGLKDGIREETQLCAGSRTAMKDTCKGDSGGPLQVYHSNLYCMYTVIGVTSFGITCGNINIPGVYTRVYPYVNWIEKIVWPGQ